MKYKASTFLEWGGAFTAILYSLLIALNIGEELLGFLLLFISALLLSLWSVKGHHRGILILNIFYAIIAIIGMVRWYN